MQRKIALTYIHKEIGNQIIRSAAGAWRVCCAPWPPPVKVPRAIAGDAATQAARDAAAIPGARAVRQAPQAAAVDFLQAAAGMV